MMDEQVGVHMMMQRNCILVPYDEVSHPVQLRALVEASSEI